MGTFFSWDFSIRLIKNRAINRIEALLLPHKLDKADLRIINSLTGDARKTITQIAKDAQISRPTAIKKLKKLRENGVLNLAARVNTQKLGFKLAQVALKSKGAEADQKLEKNLAGCPRSLFLTQTTGNPNYLALLYGENTETLVSVIESFKSFSGTEVVSWHRSMPPLLPETFDLKVFPTKRELAPCGKKCSDCSSYKDLECLGCPAVTEYKGPL